MNILKNLFKAVIFLFFITYSTNVIAKDSMMVGAFYFPGWDKNNNHWKNIKKEFADREPITGWVDMGTSDFMSKEINWANKYKIDFFTFDWYWDFSKNKPMDTSEYALKNFIKVNNKMKFSVMWANHGRTPTDIQSYNKLIDYWQENYFKRSDYLRTPDNKPIVYIFSYEALYKNLGFDNAKLFIKNIKTKANAFVISTNDAYEPKRHRVIEDLGFDAEVGWNYIYWAGVKADHNNKLPYQEYRNIVVNKIFNQENNYRIPVYPAVMPGWDESPWKKNKPFVLESTTPEIFLDLLNESKKLNKNSYPFKMLMIESWNEFGEGAYIIPTKKWGFKYLEKIKQFKEKYR